jgi:hypothetical protein
MRALLFFVMFLVISPAKSSEILFQFSSPAFSGVGYSSHVLTIYNMELSRRIAIEAENKAALLRAEQNAQNTTMARFITNLESRVYNELARQITEKLFEGTGAQASGTFAFNGGTISYSKAGNMIAVTIRDSAGSVTTMNVPIGDFGWLTP